MKRRNLILIVFVGIIVFVYFIVWITSNSRSGNEFYKNYNSISLGMKSNEVESTMGYPFDLTLKFNGCVIGYISRGEVRPIEKNNIKNINDIPDFYANAQFLFNRKGNLVAHTWNGEEGNIHTIIGDISGTEFNKINQEQWNLITKD